MRDPKRIKPFLNKLEELWIIQPDLRFGQIIYMLENEIEKDIFYPEEKEWEEKIDILIKKSTRKIEKEIFNEELDYKLFNIKKDDT